MVDSVATTTALASDENGNLQTLTRGLDVLQAVADMDGHATAKSLCRQLGLNLSRCYHILRTLKAAGYIVRLPGGSFGVGPQGAALGRQLYARFEPTPELSTVLSRLHLQTKETSYVSGWIKGAITLLQFIPSERASKICSLNAGYTGDMHARASCKAVLAYLPPEQVAVIFRGVELRRLTRFTQCDPDRLLSELVRVRQQGYAMDQEEFNVGLCCVSAPYFGGDGQPAGSLTVSVPVTRFRTAQRDLAAAVREAGAIATSLQRNDLVALPASRR